MVESEFNSIWKQYTDAKKNQPDDAADEDVEKPEQFYRTIAERRVRLGLLLAAVGQRNNIDVSAEEVNRALIAEAQRYPGQEKKIIETYRENEKAMANIRAPLFEDKVVDFILEMASVSERTVSVEELKKEIEAEQAAAQTNGQSKENCSNENRSKRKGRYTEKNCFEEKGCSKEKGCSQKTKSN